MAERQRPDGTPGPPDKLTATRVEALVKAFRAGMYQKHAARVSGVHPETLIKWRRIGSGPEPTREEGERKRDFESRHGFWVRCVELVDSIEKAQAEFMQAQLETIEDASAETWQAAAWLLERRFKDLFSLRVEKTGAEGGAITVEASAKTMEKILADPDLTESSSNAAIAAELERLGNIGLDDG